MTLDQMRSILDSIDANPLFTYFRTKSSGIEVWVVTDFRTQRITFMSKEKAIHVSTKLNNDLIEKKNKVNQTLAAYKRTTTSTT